MERNVIMSEVALSYQELRCLDAHFRPMQRDAVVCLLKNSSADLKALPDKINSQFSTEKPRKLSPEVAPRRAGRR